MEPMICSFWQMPSLPGLDGIVPIPAVFMKKLPFVALQDRKPLSTESDAGVVELSSRELVQKKKDRRKMRHERWLQSE